MFLAIDKGLAFILDPKIPGKPIDLGAAEQKTQELALFALASSAAQRRLKRVTSLTL